jgi:glycosyltransferase involved in cell wall biosynthesis
MSARPAVACVIPTHGRPALLTEALRSVAAQSLRPAVIYVVDDEGSEQTKTAVAAVARKSSVPVYYFAHAAGRGPSTSRNYGARVADTEWLAFLDDDDRWLPDYLRAALAHESADIVLVSRWDFDGAGVRRPGKTPEPNYDERRWLRRNLGGTGSSILIRRELFLAIGGFDPRLHAAEDRDLVIRAMRAGARYAAVEERLLEHRDDGPRLTTDARVILASQLRFLRKHVHAMSAADVLYALRKIAREVGRARWRDPGSVHRGQTPNDTSASNADGRAAE